LYIFLTNIEFNILRKHDDWKLIYERIICIKNSNTTDNIGVSHKSKFKHMDILDKCK